MPYIIVVLKCEAFAPGGYVAAQRYKNADDNTASSGSRDQTAERYSKLRRKRTRKGVLKGVLIALLIAALGAVGFGAWYISKINATLNEGLGEELTTTLSVREKGQPFYMLLLGIDKDSDRMTDPEYGEEDYNYRSDSIMLVRVDPQKLKVSLLSIHRDIMMDMGEYGTQKLNAAYSIGGAANMVDVVSKFCDVPISHYAEVDMDRFTSIVDKVGGITVNLPVDVYDPDFTGLDLKAGEQTLDGRTAALLCRARHAYDNYGDGDVFRAANQRNVISGIVKKVLASDPVTMASLVSSLAESVRTDMDVATILALADEMRGLNVETDVYSAMTPTSGEIIDGIWYEIMDEDAWKIMMDRMRAGLPPRTDDMVDYTAGISAESAE